MKSEELSPDEREEPGLSFPLLTRISPPPRLPG